MQIKISARHGHLSEAHQQFIRDKAQKLLHIFQRLTMIEVLVDFKEDDTLVEFLVSAEHKHDFVATERAGDLMASLDGSIHKVEQQLRKYKQKVQDHHKSPGLRQQGLPEELESAGD